MDLGTLLLSINLSTDDLYRNLDRAKVQVAQAGREMEATLNRRVDSINQSLKLVAQVDDSRLFELNKHIDLKVKHAKQANRELAANPLTVQGDTTDVDKAFDKLNKFRKAYQEVNAYVRNNPIVIGTDNGGIDESINRLGEIPQAVSRTNQKLKSNPVKLSANTIELDQTEQKLNRYEQRIKGLRRTSVYVGVKDSVPQAVRAAADSATAAKNVSEGKPFYAAAEAYKQAKATTPPPVPQQVVVKGGGGLGTGLTTVVFDRTIGRVIELAIDEGFTRAIKAGTKYFNDAVKANPVLRATGIDKELTKAAKQGEREITKGREGFTGIVKEQEKKAKNLLSAPIKAISAPARETIRGFYGGIGYAYGSRFGEGSLEGLQKRTGFDLKKAGSQAVGATGYLAGVGNLELLVKSIGGIQDIENTLQPVLKKYGLGQEQRFNVNKAVESAFGTAKAGLDPMVSILDKSLDADRIQTDIADTKAALAELTLALIKLDGVAGKAQNLRDLTGRMAAYPSQAVVATYKKSARESAKDLQGRLQEPATPIQPLPEGTRKVAMVSGGFAGLQGKGGYNVQRVVGPLMAKGTHTVVFENREFEVDRAATDDILGWAQDVAKQLSTVLHKGYNPASVRMAAEAAAYKKANPDVDLDLIGYSAGGLIAREAQEILKEMEIDSNVLTIGSPNLGAFESATDRAISLFGVGDPLKNFSANRLKDFGGVSGHALEEYELDENLKSIIQRFSAEGVTPELIAELRSLKTTVQQQTTQAKIATDQAKTKAQSPPVEQPVTPDASIETGDPQQLALKARALMLSQQARGVLPGFDPKTYGKSASAAAANQKQAEQALADLAKLDLSTDLSVEHVNTLRQAVTRLTALMNRVGNTAVPALDELGKLPVNELQQLVSKNLASDQAQQVGQLQSYLQTFTRKDLQTIAKQSGASGYSKLNKSDLINLLSKDINRSSQLAKEQDTLKQIREAEKELTRLAQSVKKADPAKQEQMGVELRSSVLSLIDKINDAMQTTQTGENRQYIGGVKGRLEQQYLRSFNVTSFEQMRERLERQGQQSPQNETRVGVDDVGLARILPNVQRAYQAARSAKVNPPTVSNRFLSAAKSAMDGLKGLGKIFDDTQSVAQRRYEEIAKETAKLSGVKLNDRQIPKLKVDPKRLESMGVGAFYDIQKNQVIISKEIENILKDAQNLEEFSEEVKAVVHELRHSLQLKGGKLSLSKIAQGRQQFAVSMTDPGGASLQAIENADKSVEAIRREALKRNGYRITGAEERTIRQAEIDAYQFEQNTPQIAKSVQQALDSEMQAKMQSTAKSMVESVDEIAQAFEQVFPGLGRYTTVFGQRLSSLGAIAGSVATAFISFKILQGLIGLFRSISNGALEAARSMEKFAITIEFSKGGQAKGVEGLAFVRDQVDRMAGDFQSAARGYTQVSAAARGTSLEGYEADEIFKAFEQAANVYQLDTPSKDRLFTAVQQIMSKETISSEELKQQIGEVLPGFMQTVARSRGETVSEVMRALQNGELTANKDLPKIAQQLQAETSGGLAKSLESSQAAVNRFNTSMYEFKSLMGGPLVEVEKLGLNVLSGVLGSVGDHVDFVVKAFAILSGMAVWKLAEGLIGVTAALYGFLVQLGLVPPLAMAAKTALTVLKGALIEVAGNFALIYAGITVAQAAFELFSDRSGELGKNARASSAGLDALTESLNRAAEAGENLSEKTKNLTATGIIGRIAEDNRNDSLMGQQSAFAKAQQTGLLSGDSLRRIPGIGGIMGGAADILNADLIEVVNQQAVDRQLKAYEESVQQSAENVQTLIKQAEGFTGGQANDAIESIKRIDKLIEENQTKQRTLRIQDPGNTDEMKRLQQEAEKLNIERGQYAGDLGTLQQELQATLDRRKQDLETLNGLLKNNNIDQETYNKLAKQTTSDIQAIENAQIDLNKKIGEGSQKLAEFNKALKQISAELADAKENAEINVNVRRASLARSEIAGGFTPGGAQAAGDQINIQGLQEQIDATTSAMSRYEAQIANSNVGRTLELMGISDPTSLGTGQIQNLKELYQGNAQETAALEAIEKLRQTRIETSSLTAQLSEAQVQAQRSVSEATRQVADFYRQTMRGVEEFQRSIESLNLSQQVTEAKLELQRNISGFTGRFFGFLGDTLSGLLEQLYEPERIMLDAQGQVASLQSQLQDQSLNATQTQRGVYGGGAQGSGLYTGPSANIGGSSDYHIDAKFARSLGMDKIVEMFDQMAQFYASQNRQIEFSNAAVSGQIYNSSDPNRRALLEQAFAAHHSQGRDASRGVYSVDYYTPTVGTDRFSSSVEGAELAMPSVSGGRVEYSSGGGYGNYANIYDGSGGLVFQTGHGDDRRSLPSGFSFQSAIGGGLQTSSPTTGVDINRLREAIAGQESGGDYNAVNPHSGALGRYQVMPENVPYWSEKYLGQSMSPDAFLADPQMQDQLVNAVMGDMLERALSSSGGDSTTAIRRVAAEWYSGQPDLYNDTAPQSYGAGSYPSINDYTLSIAQRYGQTPATGGVGGQMATVNTAPINQSTAAYQQVGGQYGGAIVSEAAARSELARVNIQRSIEKFQQQIESGADQLSDTRLQRQRQLEDVFFQPLQNTQFGQQFAQGRDSLRQLEDQRTESQRLIRDTERDIAAIEAALQTAQIDPRLQDLVAPLTDSLVKTKTALAEFQSQADQYDAAYSQAQAAVDRQNRQVQSREREAIGFQERQLQGRLDIQGVRDSGVQGILQSPLDIAQIQKSYEDQTRQIQDDIQTIYTQIEQEQERLAAEGLPLNSDLITQASNELERLKENLELIRDNEEIEIQVRVLQNQQALDDFFYGLQSNRIDAQASAMEGRGDIYGAATLRQSDAELTENRRYFDQVSAIDSLESSGLASPEYIARIRAEAEALNQMTLEGIDRQFLDLNETLMQVGQNALGGFIEDLLVGKNALESLRGALSNLASQLAQMAVQQLFAGIFGGSPMGGMAPTTTSGGTMSTVASIGASLAGAFFGGGIGGFKDGGVVEAVDHSAYREGYGQISQALAREGPNAVLAALTPNERVLTVRETQEYERLQQMGVIGNYKRGGRVGGERSFPTPQLSLPRGGDVNVNVPVNIESDGKGGKDDRMNEHKLRDGIRSAVIEEIIRQKNPGGALYR